MEELLFCPFINRSKRSAEVLTVVKMAFEQHLYQVLGQYLPGITLKFENTWQIFKVNVKPHDLADLCTCKQKHMGV